MWIASEVKRYFTGKHRKGQPLGQNKKEGLGIKLVMSGENLEGSEEIARKSTRTKSSC
jgi:hypothetical protein